MQIMRLAPQQMQALDSRGLKAIPNVMVYLSFAILVSLLLALSVIDLKTFRLPNVLTYSLIGTGLLDAWLNSGDIWARVIGAAIGYGVFLAIEVGYRSMRGQDGLGRGDAKLLAGGGAWTGWFGLPFIVLIASFMGLVAALFPSIREQKRIPFGPFLAIGILIVWFSLNNRTLLG